MSKLKFRGSLSPIMSAIRLGSDVMRVSIDIPLTERENAIGLLALTDQLLTFEIGVEGPKPQRQERQLKGPYSRFWEYLYKKRITDSPELIEALECEHGQVWDRLHEEFEVDTMAVVGPRQFEEWAEERGLTPLVTLSRLAERDAVRRIEQE